ncbi:hypothetical protein [Peribacillus simplex]|uniref:hypothetical protein n=1 Tax=Peribacillus simplex TaxID=1478 RepID=UPI0037CAD516
MKQALDAYKLHLEQLLEEYDFASSQLERVTQEVTNVLEKIPFVKQILGIKGISEILLAGIPFYTRGPESLFIPVQEGRTSDYP